MFHMLHLKVVLMWSPKWDMNILYTFSVIIIIIVNRNLNIHTYPHTHTHSPSINILFDELSKCLPGE